MNNSYEVQELIDELLKQFASWAVSWKVMVSDTTLDELLIIEAHSSVIWVSRSIYHCHISEVLKVIKQTKYKLKGRK